MSHPSYTFRLSGHSSTSCPWATPPSRAREAMSSFPQAEIPMSAWAAISATRHWCHGRFPLQVTVDTGSHRWRTFKNLPQWVQQQIACSRLNLSRDSTTTAQQPDETGKERVSARLSPARLPHQQCVPSFHLSLCRSCPHACWDSRKRPKTGNTSCSCQRNSCKGDRDDHIWSTCGLSCPPRRAVCPQGVRVWCCFTGKEEGLRFYQYNHTDEHYYSSACIYAGFETNTQVEAPAQCYK